MLNKLAFVVLFLVGGFAYMAAPAAAQDEAAEIRSMLQERDREIKRILGDRDTFTPEQRARLQQHINDLIDFREMGRLALGDHWNELSDTKRREFVDVFSQVVRNQSMSDLDIYRAQVTYDDIRVRGNTATVVTTTTHRNVRTNVEYDMVRQNEQWVLRDISLDGVSTAQGYARSFQNVIRRRGFDALMSTLHRRLERG